MKFRAVPRIRRGGRTVREAVGETVGEAVEETDDKDKATEVTQSEAPKLEADVARL